MVGVVRNNKEKDKCDISTCTYEQYKSMKISHRENKFLPETLADR